jgi:hypothetical protein
MRKVALLLVAAGLTVPAGMLMAQSASAAGGTTCTKGAGSFTIKPPLHALQPAPKAETNESTATSTATGTVSGCSGAVKSGTTLSKFFFADPTNCNSIVDLKEPAASPPTVGPFTIKWNTGKTTTVASAKLTSGAPGKSVSLLHVGGKITSGLFAGLTISTNVTFTQGKNQCITAPFSSGTYTGSGSLKIA